jgi:membrane protein
MNRERNRLDTWRDRRAGAVLSEIGAYIGFALKRFHRDRGMQAASSLTYTTLLSLVPLLAIAFAIFAAFPAFETARGQLEAVLFSNLMPGVEDQIRGHLNSFLENTGQLGTVGVVALGLSALLLLGTIEATFNRIWRVDRPRPLVVRFLIYWGVLTLGPLLIGAAITLTTDVFSVARDGLSHAGLNAEDLTTETGGIVEQLISVALQTALFTVLFAVIPNRRVAWRDALIGGFVSGAGFQLLKVGFAWYLANVLTYQTIYGAMAVFPIFLIWLYLSWCIALLGAVFAASFPDWWRARAPNLEEDLGPGGVLTRAILILAALRDASVRGEELTEEAIAGAIGAEGVDEVLGRLREARYIAVTDSGASVLCRDLAKATMLDLYRCLRLGAMPGAATDTSGQVETGAGPNARVQALIADLGAAEGACLETSIAEFIGD